MGLRRSISEAKRSCTLDEAAFDHPDTNEDAAYWIGFLMADGWVWRNRISVAVSGVDHGHIETYKRFLNSSHKIYVGSNTRGFNTVEGATLTSLTVTSTKLVQALAYWGVVPRKSHIARALQGIETNHHFWRGVVDGDGYIRTPVKNGRPYPTLGLVGSYDIVHQFRDFVLPHGDGQKCTVCLMKGRTWMGQLSGTFAVTVAHLLYDGCRTSLNRKAVIAENLAWSPKPRGEFDYSKPRKNAKVNPEQVREIRRRAAEGESQRSLAELFGLTQQGVSSIVRRTCWKRIR